MPYWHAKGHVSVAEVESESLCGAVRRAARHRARVEQARSGLHQRHGGRVVVQQLRVERVQQG